MDSAKIILVVLHISRVIGIIRCRKGLRICKDRRIRMNNLPITLNNSCLLVDLNALRENVGSIRAELSPDTAVIPVLKGDAYGLGMVPMARALASLPGIGCFALAHVSEGLALRRAGITREILLLGNPLPQALEAGCAADLTFTVGRIGLVEALAQIAERQQRRVKIQLKLDTGLRRVGAVPGEELAALLRELDRAGERISLEGVYSHFADTDNAQRCSVQYELYLRGLEQVEKAGFPVKLRHICDSAASELYPEYHLDAVRLGRRLMMDHPTAPRGNIREIVSWRTWITGVHSRKAGETLGYADAYTLPHDAAVGISVLIRNRHAAGAAVLLHGVEMHPAACREAVVLKCFLCFLQCFICSHGLPSPN